jgi:hypothetical protein
MFIKKYLIVTLVILAALATVVYIFRPPQNLPSSKIVDAETVQNLKLVTFSNGTTKILYHDYDFSDGNKGWGLTLTIPAAKGDGRQLPVFVAPHFTYRGSNWEREVYTYNYPDNGCDTKILYINRAAKSAETLKISDVPYCIRQTLDIHDYTHFYAESTDGKTVAVGIYEDGKILASVNVDSAVTDTSDSSFKDPKAPKIYWPPLINDKSQVPVLTWLASNWENTKLAFTSGGCDIEDGDQMKFIIWDTTKGILINKRASLHLTNCGDTGGLAVAYDRNSDAFDIYNSVPPSNQFKYFFSVK